MLLFFLGMFIYRFIVSKVMKGPALAQFVVTFGVSIFIANFAVFLWTPDFRIDRAPAAARHLGSWVRNQLSIPKLVASIGSIVACRRLSSGS